MQRHVGVVIASAKRAVGVLAHVESRVLAGVRGKAWHGWGRDRGCAQCGVRVTLRDGLRMPRVEVQWIARTGSDVERKPARTVVRHALQPRLQSATVVGLRLHVVRCRLHVVHCSLRVHARLLRLRRRLMVTMPALGLWIKGALLRHRALAGKAVPAGTARWIAGSPGIVLVLHAWREAMCSAVHLLRGLVRRRQPAVVRRKVAGKDGASTSRPTAEVAVLLARRTSIQVVALGLGGRLATNGQLPGHMAAAVGRVRL